MNLPYPQSFHCRFDGFPPALDVRMGSLGGAIVPGASLGSKFVLSRTPKCGILQGQLVVGGTLPDYNMVYSDTGSDEDFDLKVLFSGVATFYKNFDSDTYLKFNVYKSIEIHNRAGNLYTFGDTFECETFIPASSNETSLFEYDSSHYNFSNEIEYDGNSELIINYEGQEYRLLEHKSVQLTSPSGLTMRYSMVDGKVFSLSYRA